MCFSWRDSPDRLQQAAIVEPIDPFEGGVFNGLQAAPWPSAVDDFGIEQTVDRFGQGIVIGPTEDADRRCNFRLCQSFGVFDR